MADAKITKIGLDAAVAAEKAAEAEAPVAPAAAEASAPNIAERRVVGKVEYPAPNGTMIVVEHL